MIWKYTVSSCTKIRSFYAFLFICSSIASSLVFFYALSARVLTVPLKITSYPVFHALAKNFPNHIFNLYLSPLKGILLILFYSVLLDLTWWWSLVYPPRIIPSVLEISVNLYYDKFFYMMCFNFIIIRLMIILVAFLNLFRVFITTKTIPTFPIHNSFLLLFRIIFCSFFFIFHHDSVPHLPFSNY